MIILTCEDCGYERSSEDDGRTFDFFCLDCEEAEDDCDCEFPNMELLCDRCA